jgi:hypothetical protein
LRLRDLGTPGFGWEDLRDVINGIAPTQESALFREQNPKSWWWTAEIDFMAALLHTMQLANWQRAGKGPQPKPVKRPDDTPKRRRGLEPRSAADLTERRKRMRQRKAESG